MEHMTNKQCIEEEQDILYVIEIWLPTIKEWGFLGKCSRDKGTLEEISKTCCYQNRVAEYVRKEKEDGIKRN